MNYESIRQEYILLQEKYAYIEQALKKMSRGYLIISSSGGYTKWFRSLGTSDYKYIPKKNIDEASDLAYKRYLELQHEEITRQMESTKNLMDTLNPKTLQSTQMYKDPKYADLLTRRLIPKNEELREWAKADYEKSDRYIENLKYKCGGGLKVRSKSEVIIVEQLVKHSIPFHYEEKLELEDLTIYPDFTIRHPETGKTYYWEHFGMMDEAKYANAAVEKMRLYTRNQIVPDINLICTFETLEKPLDSSVVDSKIRDFFL